MQRMSTFIFNSLRFYLVCCWHWSVEMLAQNSCRIAVCGLCRYLSQESIPSAVSIQHPANIEHSGDPFPKHMLDWRSASKQETAILKGHPAIRPRFAKIDMESCINSDHERDSHQRVSLKRLAVRMFFPCLKGRGRYSTEQASGLSFGQIPLCGDRHKPSDRARGHTSSLIGV
jgi:hypothetical protein